MGLKLQKELKGEICYPLKLTTQRKKIFVHLVPLTMRLMKLKIKKTLDSHTNTCVLNLEKRKSFVVLQ